MFKAGMALAALSGEKTVAEISAEFGIHQTLIHKEFIMRHVSRLS